MGEWVQEQQAKVAKAKAMLQRVRERQWNKKNKHRVPATYQKLNSVLVDYLSQNNLAELLRLAETLASKTKARD